MGIERDILADWDASLAALAWQIDCGVDEAIGEAPVNRYTAAPPPKIPQPVVQIPQPNPATAARATAAAAPPPVAATEVDPVAVARDLAAKAKDIEALFAAVRGFEHCDLKRGARNTVFGDGNPQARVMVLGGAPSREEDIDGKPFTARPGQLLDRMMAAIGLSRDSADPQSACYLATTVFWRTEGNRDPSAEEIAIAQPFVQRHISLVNPDVIIVMGNTALFSLTGQRGVTRARGTWLEALHRPVMPMLHPADLLANPAAKRDAWADLLAVQAKLRSLA